MNPDTPTPHITVDGTGLLCATLLLHLRKEDDLLRRPPLPT
ncbi:hypothetical protein [Streptomyces sp. enrichment culture]